MSYIPIFYTLQEISAIFHLVCSSTILGTNLLPTRAETLCNRCDRFYNTAWVACYVSSLLRSKYISVLEIYLTYKHEWMLVGKVMHCRIRALCQNSDRLRYKSVWRAWALVLGQPFYLKLYNNIFLVIFGVVFQFLRNICRYFWSAPRAWKKLQAV